MNLICLENIKLTLFYRDSDDKVKTEGPVETIDLTKYVLFTYTHI